MEISLASQIPQMEIPGTRKLQDRHALPAPMDDWLCGLYSVSDGGFPDLFLQHLPFQEAARVGGLAELRPAPAGRPVLEIAFEYSLYRRHRGPTHAAGIVSLCCTPESKGERPVHLSRHLFPAIHCSHRRQHHSLAVDP